MFSVYILQNPQLTSMSATPIISGTELPVTSEPTRSEENSHGKTSHGRWFGRSNIEIAQALFGECAKSRIGNPRAGFENVC
jgi:hypothetical protein